MEIRAPHGSRDDDFYLNNNWAGNSWAEMSWSPVINLIPTVNNKLQIHVE